MKSSKKFILTGIVLLISVICILSACKKDGGGETVVVTDVNGVPITDANGEALTVVLETEIVEVTNANGEKVYDEDGNVKTSIKYIPQDVGIPVTDENGVAVTGNNGEVLTTMITVPATNEGAIVTELPLTNPDGSIVTRPGGETVTYTIEYTTTAATPGDNSANWGASFGGTANDVYKDVAKTSDGGFVAVIQANSKDGSMQNLADGASPAAVLIKYGKDGKMKWQKAISSDAGIIFMAVDVDANDNIIAVGYTKSNNLGFNNFGDYDALIYKFNSSGDTQWVKNFGGGKTDGFNDISVSPDGSYVVAGFTFSYDGDSAQFGIKNGDARALILKYSPDGALKFQKAFGAAGDTFKGVVCDTDNSIYAVGVFESNAVIQNAGRSDACVMKLTGNGDTQWISQYGGSKIDTFNGITLASDGGCVIAGMSKSNDGSVKLLGNYGGYDAVAVKFDSDGSFRWHTAVRGYNDEAFESIDKIGDNYVAVGYSNSSNRDLKAVGNRGGQDAIVVTIASTGSIKSIQGYGGSRDDNFGGVCVLDDNQIIACGSTFSKDGDLIGSKYTSDGSYSMGMIAKFK